MKTLILGGTGFIGSNISGYIANADSVNSDVVNFLHGPGIDTISNDYDCIINCVGRYGGIPYNQRLGKQIFLRTTPLIITLTNWLTIYNRKDISKFTVPVCILR